MRLTTLFFTATLIFSDFSFALVDMNNACYSNNWIDLEVPGSGYAMRVLRAYKSRSLYNGIFGFGWCSEYETRLNQTPEGGVKVSECGDGEEIFYSAREVSKADKESVIKRIFENMKATGKNPGFSADYMAHLKKQLMRDQTARENYAAQYKVTIQVNVGAVLMANGREIENVVLQKNFYTRNLSDGTSQRFDLEGRLVSVYNKNGDVLNINYEKERIVSLENSKAVKLSFQYFPNGKVQKVTGPGGLKSEYRYSENDDLIWNKPAIAKSDTEVNTYEYNEYHNMTKAVYPDKTFTSMKYDNQKDWVTSFTDREKCVETYKYESSATQPELNYWALTTKVCDGITVASNRYEFWHKQLPAGQTVLSRIQTNINGSVKDVIYDDVLGKPLSIKTDTETAEYKYLPNGLLKSKLTPQKTLEFSYDSKTQKISKVVEKVFDGKRIPQIRSSSFKYDSKGNLIFAENSAGKSVKLTHDMMGRIITLVDGKNPAVTLKYEEKFGKPSEIVRQDFGSVKITYNAKGEIANVTSSKGPLAAEMIAGSYNTLMGILAPVEQNIY